MQDVYTPEGMRIGDAYNREQTASLAALSAAMERGAILEGRAVKCDASHNLLVSCGQFRGIVPRSECAYMPDGSEVRDIAVITRVGKSVCFTVTGISEADGEPLLILSRREAQRRCFEEYVARLVSGDVVGARVTHIESFGAFCDIGCGVVALLAVDGISVSRIRHPSERFSPGDFIKCAVAVNDPAAGRVTLTHKELLGTWEENAAAFSPGETAAGVIRSVEPYGVFVELAPNLAGLAEWCEGAEPGKGAAVYIKSIIPEKMKIKLVIVDTGFGSPPPAKPRYFIEDGHIGEWIYSPESAPRTVGTVFDGGFRRLP